MNKKIIFAALTAAAVAWAFYDGFTRLNMLLIIVLLGFLVAYIYKW